MESDQLNEDLLYQQPAYALWLYLPASWVPYAELMRLDRPAGFFALYTPCLFGLVYATSVASVQPTLPLILRRAILFMFLGVLARGAGCTWNDNIDQDFDRQTKRCRLRPIARGAVSRTEGHVFALSQLAAIIVLSFTLPSTSLPYACAGILLSVLYPFSKRYTSYPQLILGCAFSTTIPLAAQSLYIDPLSSENRLSTVCICAANVAWTAIYDTIYGHQDVNDDLHIGIKSMAVRFRHSTKWVMSYLACTMIASLTSTGILTGMGPLYYFLCCGGSAVSLFAMIIKIDLNKTQDCGWWFNWGFLFVGGSVVGGFLAGNAYLGKEI